MKVIDLLNKIANGEEAPKRIKTINDIWVYDDRDCEGIDYRASDDRGYMFEVYTRINKDDLNEEVEIIEEDKNISKLDFIEENTFSKRQNGMTSEDRRLLDSNFKEIGNKINEIIDKLNEIERDKE